MFFETTINGKTADLAMDQKKIIDTLHKEGKSQRVITERGDCSQSAVSKHIKCKVDWKEEIGGKCAQATGSGSSFTGSELKLESVHQESPRSDIFMKRATKPLLKQKQCQKHVIWAKEKNNWTVTQWSKVLFSDKSQFSISFGNQSLEEEWRGTVSKLFEVQCEVSTVCDDLGCRDVCWCWSIVFYQVQSQCSHLP